MKRIKITQRANAPTKHDMRKNSAIGSHIDLSHLTTRKGKIRYLSVRKCTCGRMHYGARDRFCRGKQKEVARMCPSCFEKKYKKKRPVQYRFLTNEEIKIYEANLQHQGVVSYFIDPSTL